MIIESLFILLASSTVSCNTEPTLHDSESTTCEEFSRYARFNPYSVLDSYWFMFYYWGPVQNKVVVNFTVPTEKQIKYLKYLLDGHVPKPIDWSARLLLMMENTNNTLLLVEQSDRGEYLFYQPLKGLKKGKMVPILDMRLKQVRDNRYIGMMLCEEDKVFAFSRITDVPKKVDIQDAAATLGYRGRGGKSYLYQGHLWMPIPEADEEELYGKKKKESNKQIDSKIEKER